MVLNGLIWIIMGFYHGITGITILVGGGYQNPSEK